MITITKAQAIEHNKFLDDSGKNKMWDECHEFIKNGGSIEYCKAISFTYRFLYWLTKSHEYAYKNSNVWSNMNHRYYESKAMRFCVVRGIFMDMGLNEEEAEKKARLLDVDHIRIYENIEYYQIKAIKFQGQLGKRG